jgi:hypothetical protein
VLVVRSTHYALVLGEVGGVLGGTVSEAHGYFTATATPATIATPPSAMSR